MSVLSNFTRPTDPIDTATLAAKILADTGKTVGVEVTATDVLITGTVSESDRAAIQASMAAYFYPYLQTGILTTDNPDMSSNRHDKGITEHAAYMADTAVFAASQRKAWLSGVLKANSFVYYSKATTTGGTVIFYLTDDGTSSGNAVFTNVYADSVTITPYGSAALYQVSSPVISNDKKTITATINQVTSVVLGLISIASAVNNIPCTMLVLGD